ncbi:MAG: hypothetical protein ACOVNL_06710 [Prochlorococcaceae cyanobacterium]|jgi:hemerythrin
MARSLACSAQAPVLQRRWPLRWEEQKALLERQHARLEGALLELLDIHRSLPSHANDIQAQALDHACRRLLWDLRLHLRLEERWLAARGCLCTGHRAAHAEALRTTVGEYLQCRGEHQARCRWLLNLRAWFLAHLAGPDATAYALAHRTP